MNRLGALLGLALLWSGVDAQALAAAPATAPCSMCHDRQAAWQGRTTVHAPVAGGDCLACHNPHAARHGALQRQEPRRQCLTCHQDLGERMVTGAVHQAIDRERQCLACHDPHASDRAALLTADGAALCATCHEPTGSSPAHPHQPFTSGKCLTCHDPHVSAHASLLVKKDSDLCSSCHGTTGPKITAAHRKIAVAGSNCVSCHAPHGSSKPAMIRERTHAPFAEGTCDTCHSDPGAAPASLRDGAVDLCTTCHEAAPGGHPVPPEGACLACHDPHASPGGHLIAGAERQVCLSCHTDIATQRERAMSFHPATASSPDCTTCHEVHTGKTAWLLRKEDAQKTCGTCHASHAEFSHPMGEGVPDPSHPGQSVGCLSCHDPHGTPFTQFLLADPRQELCLRCHETSGF